MKIIFRAEPILSVPGDVTDENAKWIMANLEYSATPLYSGASGSWTRESGGWIRESETQLGVVYIFARGCQECRRPVSNSGHLAQTKIRNLRENEREEGHRASTITVYEDIWLLMSMN